MIKSLDDVLQRPFFAARLTGDERNEFVLAVRANASFEIPDPSVTGVADDAEDDAVLGTAVEAQADVIVTGDKGMLAIRTCRGIPIITAREFLVLVNA
jgi:predicted nucleic acid-binding protein